MTKILSEVCKQTTPDSSVYIRDGVKRLVYALPARIVASHTKFLPKFLPNFSFWPFL